MRETIAHNFDEKIRFNGRDLKFRGSFSNQSYRTGKVKGRWLNEMMGSIDRTKRYARLTYQLYYGNPALLGKNWTKNQHYSGWVNCPLSDLLIDFDLPGRIGGLVDYPFHKWWGNTLDFFDRYWIAEDDIIISTGDSKAFASLEWDDNNIARSDYWYHTLGRYRGNRGTTFFDMDGHHRIVTTTREVNPLPGNQTGEHWNNQDEYVLLYDNDYGLWRTRGNNGLFTFNQIHHFRRKTWHDDFHRGHWVCGMSMEGYNNGFIYNFHTDMDWEGTLAADTWGPHFKLQGNNNIAIFNVYDTVRVDLRGKMGEWFIDVENKNSNLAIINMFGSGRIVPLKGFDNWMRDANSRWRY